MQFVLSEEEMAALTSKVEANAREESLAKVLNVARLHILNAAGRACRNDWNSDKARVQGGYCDACPVFDVYGHDLIRTGCRLPKDWSK